MWWPVVAMETTTVVVGAIYIGGDCLFTGVGLLANTAIKKHIIWSQPQPPLAVVHTQHYLL